MATTLGKMLREKRESRYLSLPEAELATHVKAEHLRALEEERFDDLPAPTYAELYLREYARFLDLDVEAVLALYHQRMRWPRFRQRFNERLRRLGRSAGLWLILGALIVTGLLVGLFLLVLPSSPAPSPTPTEAPKHLLLYYPPDQVQAVGPEIALVGSIPSGARLAVNGTEVLPQADGHFALNVALNEGRNTIRVRAWDATGWQEEITRTVILPVPTPQPTLSMPATRDLAADFQVVLHQIDVNHYPDVVAYFSVFDSEGEPWPALTLENLAVAEDDSSVDFALYTVPPTEPLAIALVIDISGSMYGEPLAQAIQALRTFIANLGPDDVASLIAFHGQYELLQPFTTDKGMLMAATDRLQAGGETTLYDAVRYALDQVSAQPFGRRVIIVLSDGKDTASLSTLDDLIARAVLLNIPIYTLGLQQSQDFDAATLERLALETGAVNLLTTEAAALQDLYAQLGRQFRRQYLVMYRSPAVGGTEHRLTLTTRINGVVRQSSKSYRVP